MPELLVGGNAPTWCLSAVLAHLGCAPLGGTAGFPHSNLNCPPSTVQSLSFSYWRSISDHCSRGWYQKAVSLTEA
jgi:hypothetical protein